MKYLFIFFVGLNCAFSQEIDSLSVFIQEKKISDLIEKKIRLNKNNPTTDCYVIQLFCGSREATNNLKAQFNEKYESLIPGMSGIVKF